MFEDFLKRRREKKVLREWQRSPLGRALAAHVNEYFTKYPRFSTMEPAEKERTIADLYKYVEDVVRAEKPGLMLRESLAALVISFAELQVLCLTEAEKQGAFYADCPYVSGELYHQIDKAVPHVAFLGEMKWKNPSFSNSDLVGLGNARSGRIAFYLNGLNCVRFEFKDHDAQKDWFRPFMRSMLIWQEDLLRQKIGLPSLLQDKLGGLKHSTFMNLVVNGFANPYYEWEKKWGAEPN